MDRVLAYRVLAYVLAEIYWVSGFGVQIEDRVFGPRTRNRISDKPLSQDQHQWLQTTGHQLSVGTGNSLGRP